MLPCPSSFDQLKPCLLSNTCSFVLVEGFFSEYGILKYVMHKFVLEDYQNLPQLISNYGHDLQKIEKHVFVSMSLLPLCQIYGPKMHGWGVDHNISSGKNGALSMQLTTLLMDYYLSSSS